MNWNCGVINGTRIKLTQNWSNNGGNFSSEKLWMTYFPKRLAGKPWTSVV
jgi:hypothetical protein